MPKLVTLQDVLQQVYIWGGMERCIDVERQLSYATFKKIMLGSELIVTEKTIRQKFDQIVAAGFATEMKANRAVIVLDVPSIRKELVTQHKISESVDDDKPTKCGSHTDAQTRRQTEVVS